MNSKTSVNRNDQWKKQLWAELAEAEQLESVKQLPDHTKLNKSQVDAVIDKLERYTMSPPTEEQTAALLTTLYSSAANADLAGNHAARVERFSDHWLNVDNKPQPQPLWLRLYSSLLRQIHLFTWPFWVVSFLVIIAGTWIMPWFGQAEANPFIFMASLLGGFSVFYSLRSARSPMAELEATFPVTPVQLLTGRMSVLLLYDIVLALAASVVLRLLGVQIHFVLFVISWLVPLCFSTVFALAAMLRFGTLSGAILFVCVWSIQLSAQSHLRLFHLFSSPESAYWLPSKVMAVMLTGLLLFYVWHLLRTNRYYACEGSNPPQA